MILRGLRTLLDIIKLLILMLHKCFKRFTFCEIINKKIKKIMSTNECIEIPQGLEITSKTKDLHNKEFMVKLKVQLNKMKYTKY